MAYQRPLLKGLQGRFYMPVKTFKTFRMLFKCVLRALGRKAGGPWDYYTEAVGTNRFAILNGLQNAQQFVSSANVWPFSTY